MAVKHRSRALNVKLFQVVMPEIDYAGNEVARRIAAKPQIASNLNAWKCVDL